MTITNEPDTLSRLAGPGVAGGTGTSFQSDTRNSGGDGLRTRPVFEDACVTALEDFRRGRIDRTAVTTRIAIAVASACLPDAEETETFERYFSFIERDENELRSAGSETRAGRTGLGNSPSEARAGEKHGQGDETDEESRSRTIQSESVRASKRHKERSRVSAGDKRGVPVSPDGPSCEFGDESSTDADESSDESNVSSSTTVGSSAAIVRRRKVKLDLRYLKRATKTAEAKGTSKQL
jgi:hypothetical protein